MGRGRPAHGRCARARRTHRFHPWGTRVLGAAGRLVAHSGCDMTSNSTANLPLTYLFVPGNRADRYDKALGTSAGAIIIDFEDAVSPADKAAARTAFAAWYRASTFAAERVLVRVNAEDTPWCDEVVAVLADSGLRGVMLP